MATFLVERFWPGLTSAAAEVATAALVRAGAVVVETIVASSDEVCLWYVEAASTLRGDSGLRGGRRIGRSDRTRDPAAPLSPCRLVARSPWLCNISSRG